MTAIDGCTHRTPHKHGTFTGYTVCDCRCDDCRRANLRRQKIRNLHGTNDVSPARALAHVQDLHAAGMFDYSIAHAAGVSYNTIYCLPDRTRIRRSIEHKILSAPLGVTAVGVQRRLRALMAIGWSGVALAAELGVTPNAISETVAQHRFYSYRDRADRIVALYDRLSPGCADPCRFTVEYARTKHWAPPMAWDDDTIDDQRVKAQGTEHESPVGRDEFVAELLRQAHMGRSWGEMLERFRVNPVALERRLLRAGRWVEVSTAFGIREARAA
jgi:hypothetical protein